jgi:hypothetical protein
VNQGLVLLGAWSEYVAIVLVLGCFVLRRRGDG